ncbi:MAG: hypothetical protein SGI74_02505 [Oligoflexia bacterium]|nr:hypothetical protein [Oligoflexia bacterium]
MKRISSFLSLFTSISTLVCCALPALFVVLGAGAAFAGLIGIFPQLIWISEHKIYFFIFGAVMLSVAGYMQWRARKQACPIDPKLGEACATTRDWSVWIYFFSLVLYLIGAGFAFLPQLLS